MAADNSVGVWRISAAEVEEAVGAASLVAELVLAEVALTPPKLKPPVVCCVVPDVGPVLVLVEPAAVGGLLPSLAVDDEDVLFEPSPAV